MLLEIECHDYRNANLGGEVRIQVLVGFQYGTSLISEGEGGVVFACSAHLSCRRLRIRNKQNMYLEVFFILCLW